MTNDLYFNDLNLVDKNGYSYCVDMLRLKCLITSNHFESAVAKFFPIFSKNIEKWDSTRINEFYHNFSYSDDNCSFWFGFISNKELSVSSGSLYNENRIFNLTVEFNPNKVKDTKKLHALSYEEMLEISSEGAKVLHNRCVEIGEKFKIPIITKSGPGINAENAIYRKNGTC